MQALRQWMLYGSILAALFMSLALASGCRSPDEIAIDEQDDGTRVELEQGQILAITLSANLSTGYSWAPKESQESDLLVLTGEPTFASRSNLLGAEGTATLRFRADRPGETTLELIHRRAWEAGVEPAETYSVTVHVR